MRVVKTVQLEEGMIAAAPVKTKHGQLVVDAGMPLTDQLIARISFYGIDNIRVEGDEPSDSQGTEDSNAAGEAAPEAAPAPKGNVQAPTYSQRIKGSKTFQRFQFDYTKSTADLKAHLAPIINKEGTFDKDALFQTAQPLINEIHTPIEMFDMLHNLRLVDDSIYAHSMNVALIAGILAKWLKLPKDEADLLVLAGLLHDVGKAKIPPDVLNKPGKYTDEEFELVKSHPTLSYEMLEVIPDDVLDRRIKLAALQHHERCDGSGYPNKLKGTEIDDFAIIIAIADVYDAMTAARSYRAPLCPFQVIAAFEKEGIQKYHPKYILTFLERIANTYQNNRILLNDGRAGDIVLLNKQAYSRPIVKLNNGTCIDLSRTPELSIQSIL